MAINLLLKEYTVVQNLEQVINVYRTGDLTTSILPVIYVIEPTNVCNLNCIMCPNSRITDKGFMPLDLFMHIVDQARESAKAILLYFVGEPLIHREIIEMIRYCKEKTIANVSLSTNATLLDEPMINQLLESGLDQIILCLDGHTARTYERVRRGANFPEVLENITRFIEMNGSREKPKVIIQLIRMFLNRDEISEFKKQWAGLNCTVSVTWLDTWANQMPELVSMSDLLSPNEEEPRVHCADLWFKMVINSHGQVALCCHDWATKHILGDLNTQTIREVWNSEKLVALRRKHLARNFDQLLLCKNCKEWSKEEDEYEYFPEFQSFKRLRP